MKTKETSKRKSYNNGFKKYYYKCEYCGSEEVNQVNDGSFSPPTLICNDCGKIVTNNPITIEPTSMELALEWWGELSDTEQQTKNYKITGNFIDWLTDEEIEYVWKQENKGKPNQKQYKEFSPSLFKAYINKFSRKDLLLAYSILTESINNCDE